MYQQVEVARPFEKSKKRDREGSSRTVTEIVSQYKVLKAESQSASSGGCKFDLHEVS